MGVDEEGLKQMNNLRVKTGTTVVGIVCKDGIVIGADRRATIGNGIFIAHKKFKKVFSLTDKIVVATAGNVSDIQLLLKLTNAELNLKKFRTRVEPTVKETANLFASLSYQNIRRMSPIIAITAFLVGGKDDKGFWLYDIEPDGGIAQHDDYVAVGSGMIMAYGVLENKYKRNMSIDDGVNLVVASLRAAMQRDTPTGSGIDVFVVDDKGAREVIKGEAEFVLNIKENDKINKGEGESGKKKQKKKIKQK